VLEFNWNVWIGDQMTEYATGSDPVIEAYKKHVDRTLLRENLKKTVGERLANLVALQRLAGEARKAGAASKPTR
jgi:hypothetical protein